MISGTFSPRYFHEHLLGASELSGNLYCNSRISVLGRLRDYLRLLIKRAVENKEREREI